jgi:phosphoenolpyruvate carboxylase
MILLPQPPCLSYSSIAVKRLHDQCDLEKNQDLLTVKEVIQPMTTTAGSMAETNRHSTGAVPETYI